jgi:hypothetical protein
VGNQNKKGMIFIFYHALYEETRYNVGSLAMYPNKRGFVGELITFLGKKPIFSHNLY